jgi:hypothetical protein
MPVFSKTLPSSLIYSSLANQIISQEVFSDNIKGTYGSLAEKAKVDAGLYGSVKTYYSADILRSYDWTNDAEAQNLLQLHRPKAPEVQALEVNVFKIVPLTLDQYLTKQAFATAGAFAQFNSVMLGMVRETKRVWEATRYNAYLGTTETNIGKQSFDITPVEGQNDALTMAEALANLLVNMRDITRNYNDYQHLRSYDEKDLVVVWNSKHFNALKKLNMPTIFHTEGLLDEFKQEVLPERYFGTVNAGQTAGKADGSVRSLIEQDINGKHYFAGDEIDAGVNAPAGTSYTVDDSIAFKVIHKRSIPALTGFSTQTEFFNPRALVSTTYLIWGTTELEYLKNYPMITARFAE